MKRVLVIDDDPDIRLVAKNALEYAGYEVLVAEDGARGLQQVFSQQPHAVLIELMMPGMHGYSVCQAIRSDPSLKDVKIVVCSAKVYPTDIKKAMDLGADAYLMKPFAPDELLSKLASVLDPSGPPVKVKFWGTRGSIPTPGPRTLRYGGNTCCVEVRCGDDIIMLDCGTGAREMGHALAEEFKGRPMCLHIFMSHTHWDHIQGFPFFIPAYASGTRLNLYSLRGADKSLEKVFTGQMDANYFPVSLNDMNARLKFVELDGPIKIGSMIITHNRLNHPGLAIGFRIQAGPKSVVYQTDHETYSRLLGPSEHNRKLDREVTEFSRNADLLIREAQYTEEEYISKRGWGHSTFFDALETAHEAGVKQLAIFHHEPMRDDDSLDRMMARCHERMKERGMTFRLFASADNMQVTI
jgi:CheY-like chemotaxis protein/phosphoribosyl 1,2-cyclic phosphodiesterase